MTNSSYEWQIDVTFTSLKQTFLGWEEERGTGNFSFLLPEGTSTPLGAGKSNNCFNPGPFSLPEDSQTFDLSG